MVNVNFAIGFGFGEDDRVDDDAFDFVEGDGKRDVTIRQRGGLHVVAVVDVEVPKLPAQQCTSERRAAG